MKLYHYVHCPFCVRVRMALGHLAIPYESIVVQYSDEKTPMALTGKKMLPAFEFSPGDVINESLDIIKRLDKKNSLKNELIENNSAFELLLDEIGKSVHNLCMPYWIWTPEFSPESREYFKQKKSGKRGPFHLLVQNKETHLATLAVTLQKLEENLVGKEFYSGSSLSILDIALASHLWGMYIFPEFQFSPTLHQYLQRVKKQCAFNYHEDFWKKEENLF